jgi:ATP-binding cassette, subfamily B, bacterial
MTDPDRDDTAKERLRAPRPWRRPLPPALTGTLVLLRLLPAVSRPLTVLLALGVFVSAALPIAVTVVSGLLVGSIPAAVRGGMASPAGQRAVSFLIAAALLIVVVRVLGPFRSTLAGVFARAVDRHLQERVMAAVAMPGGISHLEDPAILDLIKNAEGVGTEGDHPGDAVRSLATLLPSWLQALGSAAVLLAFHWWLGLAWLIMWPVILVVFQSEFLRVGRTAFGQAAAVRRSDYYRELAIRPGAAKELRLWGMLDWLVGRFDASWDQAMRPVWQARRPGRPVLWLSTGVVGLFNLGALALLAWAAVQGNLSLAALAVYLNAIQGANSFQAFDDVNRQLAYGTIAIPSILDLERRLAGPPSGTPSGAAALPPDAPRDAIRFHGVRFRYPGQRDDVLAGLDLTIPAGHSLAIVGLNGAGKTTLVKLLGRLYEPDAGRITVDGIDLRALDASRWQRRVTAVFQDFAQYQLSARDNIGLGSPDGADDLKRLREAARQAGALELIEALPQGWDTVLSRRYTDGVDLSGGQWQRLALARALFAAQGGARVLILDEPTASLDVRAEADLYDRFLDITRGLTTILISHRFSTVRRAERICVLEHGRVVEQGSHEELVTASGRYAGMFALQAARFNDAAAAPVAGGG